MAQFTVNVTWDPTTWKPLAEQNPLGVAAPTNEEVEITWVPDSTVLITGISGFPSQVVVTGPDGNGNWFATYPAQGVEARWSYTISGKSTQVETQVFRHDPEIDNTPPPQPSV